MAAEPIAALNRAAGQATLDIKERQELERLRAYRRRRQMEQSISMGALGFGVMLAGFGPLGAAAGMVLGALLGYYVERRAQASSARLRS